MTKTASDLIHDAVVAKWGNDPEVLEQWYAKFTSARRAYLQKMWDEDPHCVYCKRLTTRPDPALKCTPLHATYEHKQPTSRGGTEGRRNAALSCWRCNAMKGSMGHQEFIDALGKDPEGVLKSRKQREHEKRQKRAEERACDPKVLARKAKILFVLSLMMFDRTIKSTVEESLT
mgnify:CR=1 FL=1